jgi:hypothetical protein
MDIPLLILFVASMLFAGLLAQERGRRPWRWVLVASVIGPLAIPALYLIVATSVLRKRINAQRS